MPAQRAPLTNLSVSGRTITKSRTADSAIRPRPISIISRKTAIYRKNFTPGGADIILDISEVQAKTLSVLQRAHIAKRYLDSSFIIPYKIIVENSFEFLDAHIGPFTTIKHLILDSSK